MRAQADLEPSRPRPVARASTGRGDLVVLAGATLVALWVTRGALGADMPAGLDIPGHAVLTDFAVGDLFLHGRVDGWFPGFGSGYRLFGVNGPGLALLVGLLQLLLLGTVTAGQALGILGVASLATLPWAVAALSRELGSTGWAAAVHGLLALLVSFYSGGGIEGLYGTGLIAQNLALPLQLVALAVILRAVRSGGRGRIAGGGLLVAGVGLLHPVSVVILAVLVPLLVVGRDVLVDAAGAAGRLMLVAAVALGSTSFWLLPALRDWDLKGGATFWDEPAPLPGRWGEVLAGGLLLPDPVGWAVLAALVVTAGRAVLHPEVRPRLRGPGVAAMLLLVGHVLVEGGWGPHEVVMHLPVRGAALAAVLLMQPLAALVGDALDLASRHLRWAWVPLALLLPVGVGWLLGADRDRPKAAGPPSAALAAAAGELSDRVPPMGRHILAPPEAAYYATTEPARWLAAESGTNSAHLYIWESTREDAAGQLALALFREVSPRDALDRMRRFGVTHVVVTRDEEREALAGARGFAPVWSEGEVAVFEVLAAPGRPPPGALLQPAAGWDLVADLDVVAVRSRRPEHLAWEVHTSAGTRVVAAVAFHPQWRAWVDGDPVEVDRSFRGLVRFTVPPGEHQVTLRYVPRGTDQLAALVTVVTLVVVAGVVGWPHIGFGWRRSPRGGP